MRLAVAALVLAAAVGLAASCGGGDDATGETADFSEVEGEFWELTAGLEVEGWEDVGPDVHFTAGGIDGNAGCNSYVGTFTVDGSALELDVGTRTELPCTPPADEVEAAFVEALESAAGWRLDGEELVLLDEDDEELLRFKIRFS